MRRGSSVFPVITIITPKGGQVNYGGGPNFITIQCRPGNNTRIYSGAVSATPPRMNRFNDFLGQRHISPETTHTLQQKISYGDVHPDLQYID